MEEGALSQSVALIRQSQMTTQEDGATQARGQSVDLTNRSHAQVEATEPILICTSFPDLFLGAPEVAASLRRHLCLLRSPSLAGGGVKTIRGTVSLEGEM